MDHNLSGITAVQSKHQGPGGCSVIGINQPPCFRTFYTNAASAQPLTRWKRQAKVNAIQSVALSSAVTHCKTFIRMLCVLQDKGAVLSAAGEVREAAPCHWRAGVTDCMDIVGAQADWQYPKPSSSLRLVTQF